MRTSYFKIDTNSPIYSKLYLYMQNVSNLNNLVMLLFKKYDISCDTEYFVHDNQLYIYPDQTLLQKSKDILIENEFGYMFKTDSDIGKAFNVCLSLSNEMLAFGIHLSLIDNMDKDLSQCFHCYPDAKNQGIIDLFNYNDCFYYAYQNIEPLHKTPETFTKIERTEFIEASAAFEKSDHYPNICQREPLIQFA